nr:MAG TPA: hypothetical protein [Caudoviricetes sp.]DAK43117.1 MAG TPA: hypothetical protein [Caudoviricetes sp.]
MHRYVNNRPRKLKKEKEYITSPHTAIGIQWQ